MSDDFQILSLPAREGIALLRISGRIDTRVASQLLHRCAEVRAAGDHLVLNLSGVSFIASSGIGALLALTEQFREGNTKVRFAALSSAVDSVIKLLNLDQFLSIDGTEEQALDALSRRDAA
jgi:anti-sigma B factor antagonist